MNIKGVRRQARKRHRQAVERRERNRAVRAQVRRSKRRIREAIDAGNAEQVRELLPKTISVIDTARRKGVLHANTAARYKSRLSKQAQSVLNSGGA